MLGKNRRSFD